MTIYDSVNEIKEMLFGEKGVEFDKVRSAVMEELRDEAVRIPPQYMMMKITNRCNSDCVYCNHARSRAALEVKQEIPLERLQRIIDEGVSLGVKAISLSGGEPLVRDDVEIVVKQIADNNVIPVLLTNGFFLKSRALSLYESGLRYFIVSLDSLDSRDYRVQRRVEIGPVMEGIDAVSGLMRTDETVKLHITPVITAKNILQMPALTEYFSERGVSVQFSPYHRFVFNREDELAMFDADAAEQTIDKLLRMKQEGFLIANSSAFLRHFKDFLCRGRVVPEHYRCLAGYSTIYVDTYENVRTCWSGGFEPVDNLRRRSLSDIWYSSGYMTLRKRMERGECPGCWLLCTGELTMLLLGEE